MVGIGAARPGGVPSPALPRPAVRPSTRAHGRTDPLRSPAATPVPRSACHVAARISAPLGLIDTSCSTGREQGIGYRRGRHVPSFRIPALPGASALHSTADDMLRYLQAHLALDAVPVPEWTGAGRSLRAALREVRRPRVAHRRDGSGFGLVRGHRTVGEGELFHHSGSTKRFSAFVGFDPVSGSGWWRWRTPCPVPGGGSPGPPSTRSARSCPSRHRATGTKGRPLLAGAAGR
ncbi:serine hydrolase, partial [Kitasatospora sp. NE20-6]|uniref:serine hydrolase n=1 Tax=Kitasatospora sp. NE20-6 TaxID=2859066 RepID=UPI0038B2DDCF